MVRHASRGHPPPGAAFAFTALPPQSFQRGRDPPLVGGAEPGNIDVQPARDLPFTGNALEGLAPRARGG
jgi:hypothetical protein